MHHVSVYTLRTWRPRLDADPLWIDWRARLHPSVGAKIRILVAGNIDKPKGAGRILSLRDRDVFGRLEFHILGNSIEDLKGPRIICHGPYKREAFAARAASIHAHFGAVLSIWPETYSHTLTEHWSIGLPVLAFDFGAVAERRPAREWVADVAVRQPHE
ncbi:MAG TPA: hypothetical protein VIE66_03455 [Methylocella sp.]